MAPDQLITERVLTTPYVVDPPLDTPSYSVDSPTSHIAFSPFTPYTPHTTTTFKTPLTPYTPVLTTTSEHSATSSKVLAGRPCSVGEATEPLGAGTETDEELGRYLMVSDH